MQETLEMEVQSLGLEDPLEECTATHSSILTGKIPFTEEPGRLQSKRSQIVHAWVTEHTHSTESRVALPILLMLKRLRTCSDVTETSRAQWMSNLCFGRHQGLYLDAAYNLEWGQYLCYVWLVLRLLNSEPSCHLNVMNNFLSWKSKSSETSWVGDIFSSWSLPVLSEWS